MLKRRLQPRPIPDDNADQPLVFRKRRAARKLAIGMTLIEAMIADGDLDVVRLGKRAVGITAESLQRVAREGVGHRTSTAA